MDTQLLGFSLMGILQPGSRRISGVRRDWFVMTAATIQGAQSKAVRAPWNYTMTKQFKEKIPV